MFSLEPREKKLAAGMFTYNFILLITLYLLKPVRDSLFLEQVGAHQLPFVFLLAAVIVIPVSLGYSRLSKRLSIGWLINIITLFLAANLLVIWATIQTGLPVLYYSFYVWISIYSVLITSQFWLFANTIFNPVQAKKLFAFFSLGAIAGAFAGGELTGIFMDVLHLNPHTLLPVCAVILIGTIPIVNWVLIQNHDSKSGAKSFKEKREMVTARSRHPVSDILQNKHLMLIMSLIGISVIATTIIDFQFKSVLEAAFDNEAELASFIGRFYGRVSLIAFLIQFFLGTYFTKKYGITGSILLLPLALLLSSAAFLLIPGLFMATMTRGIDQTFKHSIDRTGRELLFMPMGTQLKKRVKVFIDLFVKHGAQGLAGLLLIGLTYGLGLGVRSLGFVVVFLIIVWVFIAKQASKSYVGQLRDSIKKQISGNEETPAKPHASSSAENIPDAPNFYELEIESSIYRKESEKKHQNQRYTNSISSDELKQSLKPEVRRYCTLIRISALIRQHYPTLSGNVLEFVEIEIEQHSKNIFRLLSLNHKQEDMINAHRAITGSDPELRAQAIEFLENLFSWEIRKLIFPVLDQTHEKGPTENQTDHDFKTSDDIISFLSETFQDRFESEMVDNIEYIARDDRDIL